MKKIILISGFAFAQIFVKAQFSNSFVKDSITFKVITPTYFNKADATFYGGNDVLITNIPDSITHIIVKFTKDEWLAFLRDSTYSYAANLLLFQVTRRGAGGYEIYKNKRRWYKEQRKSELIYWTKYIKLHDIPTKPKKWNE